MSIEELQSTLTFSNLCDLIKKEMPLSILLTDNNGKKEILKLNQAEIVGLILGFRDKYMYSIMLDDKESFRSFHPSLSQYKNGKTPIPIEVRNAYGDESQKNELHKYIKETFIDNMENPGAFKEELCELINNVPDNSWKNTLLEEKDVTVLLSKALGITMNARLHMQYLKQENKKKKEKTVLAFNQKNKNNCDKISPTHSITITIAGTELPNDIVFPPFCEPFTPPIIKNQNIKNIIKIPNGVNKLNIIENTDSEFSSNVNEPFLMKSSV